MQTIADRNLCQGPEENRADAVLLGTAPVHQIQAGHRGQNTTGSHLDEDGYLYVTGRISETFKTAKGKFINPTVVETRFGDQSLLEQLCIIGLGMVNPVLVATPSELGRSMREELAAAVGELVEEVNAQCESHQKMACVLISEVYWTPENGLLTPTLKMRRKNIDAVYRRIAEKATGGEFVQFVKAPVD